MAWRAWVAQSVKHPTLAYVTISRSVSSTPASGSVATAQSLELALDSVCVCVCLSLSASPPLALCLSVILSKINIKKEIKKETLPKEFMSIGKT